MINNINSLQYSQQQEKGHEFFSPAPSKKYQSKLYLFTHLNPKIHCPLSCTFLSPKQYNHLHKKYISTEITFMGYNRTCPSALRFGCHKYSSIQLKDIQTEEKIRKIKGI